MSQGYIPHRNKTTANQLSLKTKEKVHENQSAAANSNVRPIGAQQQTRACTESDAQHGFKPNKKVFKEITKF